jgi:hypothetical protein
VRATLVYFDGCPNWQTADAALQEAQRLTGIDVAIEYRRIETEQEAQGAGFGGSPTLLIDEHDPFSEQDATVGLSCRLYRTPAGLAGSPTVDQLVKVLTGR